MAAAVWRAIRVTCSRVFATVAEASMPRILRPRPSRAAPAIIPAWVEPVTLQTMTVSKKMPSAPSCSPSSTIQFANPRPPRG